MSAPPAVRPGSAAAWKLALRPRTLWIAVVPVAVGAAFAQRHTGGIDPAAAALALAVSLLLQAIVNLHNDVGYTVRGADIPGGLVWRWLAGRRAGKDAAAKGSGAARAAARCAGRRT